jgi:hypothetical protein
MGRKLAEIRFIIAKFDKGYIYTGLRGERKNVNLP